MYIPNKATQINSFVRSVAGVPEKVDKVFTFCTKFIATVIGSAGIAKGSSDVIISLKECDHVCAVISSIGVSADVLQVATSFVPHTANFAMLIITPISVGYKTFVCCCRRGKIFWGGC